MKQRDLMRDAFLQLALAGATGEDFQEALAWARRQRRGTGDISWAPLGMK